MKDVSKMKVVGFERVTAQISMKDEKDFYVLDSEYTKLVREINKNFLIRYQIDGEKQTSLIGAGAYYKIVGLEKAMRDFRKVLKSKSNTTTIKIRKSLTIKFLTK